MYQIFEDEPMREIPGHPGYFATVTGHIYSGKTNKCLAERENRLGYKRVNLYVDGKIITREIHKLVALAYFGEGTRVLHGEGGIWDNSPANLRYGTQYENMQDKLRDGTAPIGSRNPFAKLVEEDVREILVHLKDGMSYKDIADFYDVSPRTIGAIARGETWVHVSQ